MTKVSILLGLDGSEASARAGQFALWLAAKVNARIDVCHVIDAGLVNQLVDYQRPGLIGSGPYIRARETITNAMYEVAEALMEKFRAIGEGNAIQIEGSISLGDPGQVMLSRAKDHVFVITGNSTGIHKTGTLTNFLADHLETPYIVVSPEWQIPSRLAWLTTEEDNYDSYLQYGMLLADTFGANFDLEVAAQNLNKLQMINLRERTLSLIPAHNQTHLRLINLEGSEAGEDTPLFIRSNTTTMTVLPVKCAAGYNRTILNQTPSAVLEHIQTGATVFYPIYPEKSLNQLCA